MRHFLIFTLLAGIASMANAQAPTITERIEAFGYIEFTAECAQVIEQTNDHGPTGKILLEERPQENAPYELMVEYAPKLNYVVFSRLLQKEHLSRCERLVIGFNYEIGAIDTGYYTECDGTPGPRAADKYGYDDATKKHFGHQYKPHFENEFAALLTRMEHIIGLCPIEKKQ
jgi:hypothetical protein